MRKRAALAINYIFLIFVSLIVIFVIIGMVTKWSFNANRYMRDLFGGDEEENTLDRQIINVTDCNDLQNEIVKHAKICYTEARQGQVKGTMWALCYGLPNPGNCAVTRGAVKNDLDAATIDNRVDGGLNTRFTSNVIVGYDYDSKVVTVQ